MAYPDSNDHDSTADYSDSDLSETADGLRDLREENNALKARLDMATSKIMKLQGTADQITDVEIGREVESLQDAIQWWINGVEKELRKQSRDFRHTFSQVLNHRDGIYLVNHELGFGDETSHEADIAWMRWLGDLSTCIYVVLGRNIWVYLHKEIFNETYPIGVSENSKYTFNDILSVMKSGDEDENKVLLANKWRSDTISALVRTEDFQYRKWRMMKRLSRGLVRTLDKWIDPETLERHHNTLETNLIQRAIDLHEKIVCSSYEYLIIAPGSPDLVRGEIPDESKHSSWTLKDTVRWRPIYDNIAGIFQCLYPGIYRRGMPGEENVPAAPPVVLAYDHTSPKIPSCPTRRSQPPKVLPGPGRQQTIQRSPRETPQRSPRPSPERHSQSLPAIFPPNRASTFPLLEDPASPRQSQYVANPPIMSTILNAIVPSISGKKRAKTPSSSSRNRTSEPGNHSSIDRKRSKSKSRSRPQSVSIPSSPIKPPPTYKTEEVSQITSTDQATRQGFSMPLALHGEPEGIMRARRNAHDEWEYGSDNETFINGYGAIERRFKYRSNPYGLQRRPETGSMYGT
ncbi:hypothetical protein PISL3812_05090 [Talaromyces islandicus]|uniref:Uncharacterized protein n=1 Tax=Talaromyces islandicus TaxID=28573 RepID=A0A0U1LXH1_TALIS|nr:hypothetical protein PISL3812_05090 [Talaromyces islandicus]